MQKEKNYLYLVKQIALVLGIAVPFNLTLATEGLLLEPEFRTDLQSGFSDDHSKNNSSSGVTTQFLVNRAHLNFRGAVNNKIDYRMRVRWNRDFKKQKDNTSLGLEYWYLRHHFSELIQFRIGKQFVLQGGKEGSKNPIDTFHYSRIGNRLKDFYTVGASLLLNLEANNSEYQGQTFILQLFNQIPNGNQNQYAMSYNLAWYGNFMGGDFQPVVQYGFFPSAEEFRINDQNKKIQTKEAFSTKMYSVGASLHSGKSVLNIDLLKREQEPYKERNLQHQIISHSIEQEESVVLKVQHQGERLQPFLKGTSDSVLLQKREELHSITVGVEIFPFESSRNYRLHGFFSKQEQLLNQNKIRNTLLNFGVSLRF